MATLKVPYRESKLSGNLDKLGLKLGKAIVMYANAQSTKIRSYMQRTRPWTDRTGAAKTRLNTTVTEPDEHTIRITLMHGVWYGKYLELAHAKKYAVIKPTLEAKSPEVMEGLRGIVGKVKL